jgi:hypothetical protein
LEVIVSIEASAHIEPQQRRQQSIV